MKRNVNESLHLFFSDIFSVMLEKWKNNIIMLPISSAFV